MLPDEELCNRPFYLEIDAGRRETPSKHGPWSHLLFVSFPCNVSEFRSCHYDHDQAPAGEPSWGAVELLLNAHSPGVEAHPMTYDPWHLSSKVTRLSPKALSNAFLFGSSPLPVLLPYRSVCADRKSPRTCTRACALCGAVLASPCTFPGGAPQGGAGPSGEGAALQRGPRPGFAPRWTPGAVDRRSLAGLRATGAFPSSEQGGYPAEGH